MRIRLASSELIFHITLMLVPIQSFPLAATSFCADGQRFRHTPELNFVEPGDSPTICRKYCFMRNVQTGNAIENGRVDSGSEYENCPCQWIQFSKDDVGIYVNEKIFLVAAKGNTL